MLYRADKLNTEWGCNVEKIYWMVGVVCIAVMICCGGLTQFFAGALIILMGSFREIIEAQLELARLNIKEY